MIIGITGTLGAGKGTVVEFLKAHGFVHFAVSDTFLRNEAKRRGLEPDRSARRDIANEYRAQGATKLMEAVLAEAAGEIAVGKNVIVEPQHTVPEVEFIKEQGGIVLSVDADLPVRYERITKRGSEKDHVSYEEFVAEQVKELASADPNKNNLAAAIEAADYHFLNNGSVEELHVQIEEVLAKLVK